MASKTSFLELTLPDNGEYVDNWDSVINNNFEDIDDYASDLNTELVGSTGDTGNLKGTAATVQDRIDTGLNLDGTPNLDNSPDFTNLEHSKHYGVSGASGQGQRVLDRLHFVENDMIACRFGQLSDRYGGTASLETIAGLSKLAGFHEAFGTKLPSGNLVPSVIRGFTPNSVVSGPTTPVAPYTGTHATSSGGTDVTLGGSVPTVYNIDGLWFEIADEVNFLIGAGGHTSLGSNTYLLWASRNEADYNSSSSLQWYYNAWNGESLGAAYRLNLRVIPTHSDLIADADSATDPIDGEVSVLAPTELTSDSATNFSLVRAGDILVIASPSSLAGEYLVQSASGTTLTVFGSFPVSSSQSGITFHIERRTMPALGFTLLGSAVPTAGRVVIGEFTTTSDAVSSVTGYAYNGIHDTGWVALGDFGWGVNVNHFLGAIPSSMDVWVKNAAPGTDGTIEKDPTLLVQVDAVDTQSGGSASVKNIRIPAMINQCTSSTFKVNNTDPNGDDFAYTDYGDTDVDDASASHSIRVVVRR